MAVKRAGVESLFPVPCASVTACNAGAERLAVAGDTTQLVAARGNGRMDPQVSALRATFLSAVTVRLDP